MRKQFITLLLSFFIIARMHGQVNLQTGSATFSLPMFSWQDDKSRLNSMVALSYNSGNGLKVSEVSSNAGQGWNMIAGGEIVRMQAGEPDDQVKSNGSGSGNDYDITKYPAGILYATVPAANGCPEALTKYPIYGWKNQLYAQHNVIAEDKQLDYFAFQFNGKAGMFVLDLDSGHHGEAKSLGDTKMKITFQEDAGLSSLQIRTKITSFTIQDENGLIYKFAKHGLTKVQKTYFCDENFNYKQSQPKFKNGKVYYQAGFDDGTVANPWIIGSWHLTEIEDALTHRKIYLNYATREINNVAGDDISSNFSNKDYCIVSHKRSITQSPVITSIVYPDGHTVTFNYGANRFDLNGDNVLSSVDITYQARYLSKYELTTSYFILNRYGTPVTDFQKKVARLCLLSVRKIGVDLKEDTPPYIFDYYTGSSAADDFVPPPFSYAKDIWGFFNGNNSKGFWDETFSLTGELNQIKNCNYLRGLCYMRNGVSGVYLNAKSGYAKNGLLKQIIYPTGGTLGYQYAQNTGVISGSSTNVGGVHVSQTSSTDGGYTNDCSNPIVTNYNYVLSNGTSSSLWGLEMPVNSMISYNHYQPEDKGYRYSVPFGHCIWHYQFPGILSQQQAINLTNFQKAMQIMSPVLGVLSVLGTIQDIATVVGGGSPVSLIIDVIVGIAELAITCFGDQARNSSVTMYFNADLNSAAPLPTQFKRVEVVESPGTIGKTIQEFTSDDDYAVWEPTNPKFSPKQRFAPWAYGLPKKTEVIDANGYIVKSTINTYSFGDVIFGGGHGYPAVYKAKVSLDDKSCKCEVIKSSSQRNTKWTNPATYNPGYLTSDGTDMKVDIYDMYTGRVELQSTSEKIYKQNSSSDYAETVTNYYYNDYYNYEVNRISTTLSNGDVTEKYINYTGDYSGGALATMYTNNIVSIPVETKTGLYRAGVGYFYLSEKVTEFVQLSNGDIKPSRILEQRFTQPTPTYSVTLYGGPGSSITQYKIAQTFTYDGSSGNLTSIKDEGDRAITNIYDYDDKYVVGTVVNAEPATDKPAYSSFETNVLGNWTLSGTASYTSSAAITGSRSFSMSSGKSLSVSSLNTARAYIVSFWSTTSGITVTGGATLTKSAPTINGFTYYEYDIAQGTSSVTVAGSGTIDELRLYPKTARMRTTTYDPIIGKTSDCDENNRISYYEYDNLGRLRFVKDEKGNIVKMNEYNNVSAARQNGCPGTYHNYLISEFFIRNNCEAGYQGDPVIFTVAANTYSSSISQADADAQAENYLLTYGQAYANSNGECHLIYYNVAISVTDTTGNCPPGYIGGPVTYTVPANRYSSIISQADANEKAQDEADANAAAYANDPAHANCSENTNPVWEAGDSPETNCQCISGQMHRFYLCTDVNPNSTSYTGTAWKDFGPDETCTNTCPSANISFTVGNYVTYYDVKKVTLYNTTTYASYSTGIIPWGEAVSIVIPQGTYDVEVEWVGTQPGPHWYNFGSFYLDDYGTDSGRFITYYGLPLNGTCSPWLDISDDNGTYGH